LSKSSVFFFNIYFWFCLVLVQVCWVAFPVFFIWFKELYMSSISVWFFFLRFSISLLNSSFISYAVFFISYISFS
jgi:hypothetical protein